MSISRIVTAFDTVYKRVEQRSTVYDAEGRTYRMIFLAGWAYALGRHGWGDFSRMFTRELRGELSDIATDVMDEVFQVLNVNTIDEMRKFADTA